jgi:hypothetical protein
MTHSTTIASAFEYAYPLYAVAQTRYRAVQDPDNAQRHAPNTVRHERRLSDAASRWITAPNNDTLYSNAWLDLSGGPVKVRVGPVPTGRYWSVALMDAYTNHIGMLGQRLAGCGPAEVTLVGPRHHDSPVSGRTLRVPGDDVWLFARGLVDGEADLPQAHAMQETLDVIASGAPAHAPRTIPTHPTDPANFLAVVNEALARNPPPDAQAPLVASWASVGLLPGVRDAWATLDDNVRQLWASGSQAQFAQLGAAGARGRRDIQGWIASGLEIGNFGTHYALRASVALGGLGALEPVEARYFVKFHDAEKRLLDGRRHYLLRIPPGGIPTDSFWSFSMYEPTSDGKRFFVQNPINRYSVGNRTAGLVYNADGSLDIALQCTAPDDARLRANWLPTPGGTFQISLRTYLPRPELIDGSARMPEVICTDSPKKV